MQSTERWLPVVGYEGLYEVSDLGNVRSLDGTRAGRKFRGRVLKPRSRHAGHQAVDLSTPGRRWSVDVHRLVLSAFVGPCPEGMEGCHNDGDPTNNRLGNLRWDTHRANMQDRITHGRHNSTNKVACPRGHALVAPNLRVGAWRRGVRQCLSCHSERNAAERECRPFSEHRAHERYHARMQPKPVA